MTAPVEKWFPRAPEKYLKDAFRESSFLRQFLEVLGVRVVVEREVRLHRAQLVVLERSAQSLLAATSVSGSAIFDASVCGAVTQHVEVAADDVAEIHVT